MNALMRLALAGARAWRGLWRALVVPPKLMIEKGPFERNKSFEEEYRVLREEVRRSFDSKF